MAGPSDKARFYLEQSASELNELERKKIFTREEISTIARKRSDFEHTINARGSSPSDYTRYIAFEKNVDALRRKRITRLGVRSKGAAKRTIWHLYTRATRKFSGELTLWMQYIEYARREKAYKRLNDIFTAVVRLHPMNPDLWILAATYFMDSQADITNARSYMQRGLRFCKGEEKLWVAYAKLETIYVGKIAGRRKILGLDGQYEKEKVDEEEAEEDVIALPAISAEDINPSLKLDDGVDEVALQNLASAPVLTGAIPLAIFDSAMKQFPGKPHVALAFFEMFAEFEQLSCIPRILQYVLDHLQQASPQSVETTICRFRQILYACSPFDPEAPSAIQEALDLLSLALQQHPHNTQLAETAVRQILALQRVFEDADPAIQKVLRVALRKYIRLAGEEEGIRIANLAKALREEGKKADSEALITVGAKYWSANEQLQNSQLAPET